MRASRAPGSSPRSRDTWTFFVLRSGVRVASVLVLLLVAVAATVDAATVTVLNADDPLEGFNDPTAALPIGGNPGTTVGEQRRIAVQFAADVWANVLRSNVDIVVSASFDPLPCGSGGGVLGSAGPAFVEDGFGAGEPGTWYMVALANALADRDLEPGLPDVEMALQSRLGTGGCLSTSGWYYGLDHRAPSTRKDLVEVVLHEIGHGLGFASLVNEEDGRFLMDQVDIYSRFLFDRVADKAWTDMSDAERHASIENTDGVVWVGDTVRAAAPTLLDHQPALVVKTPASVAGVVRVAVAEFGPSPQESPVTADLVRVDDGVGTTSDGCEEFINAAALVGHIALIDRGGCAMLEKAQRAQAAGAVGVVLANNVSGGVFTPRGTDPSMVIPTVMISLDDVQRIEPRLPGVNVTIGPHPTSLKGTDDVGHMVLYTPSPVQIGSSIHHWDVAATPNLLMEPYLNPDLDGGVDLTIDLLQDLGWSRRPTPAVAVVGMAVRRGAAGAVLTGRVVGLRPDAAVEVHRARPGEPRRRLPGVASVDPASGEFTYVDPAAPDEGAAYWLAIDALEGAMSWQGPVWLAPASDGLAFRLEAPRPNPFLGRTSFSYRLREPGPVRIAVYDLRGREVRVLAEGWAPAGASVVTWDGREGAGSPVGADVYFVRMEVGARSQVRKVMVLR